MCISHLHDYKKIDTRVFQTTNKKVRGFLKFNKRIREISNKIIQIKLKKNN